MKSVDFQNMLHQLKKRQTKKQVPWQFILYTVKGAGHMGGTF